MREQAGKAELLELIQANEGIIYKICHTYCVNPGDREDLTQEITYQLFRSYKNYDTSSRFTTWMYRVALNTAISFYRVTKKSSYTVALDDVHVEIVDPAPPTSESERHIQILQQCIQEQKELDKALMILYLESKSYKEIAEIIGISETNVATKISRIKEKIKQAFLQYQ